MTAIEMQYNYENRIKNHTKLAGIHIPSNEVELFLNQAQELVTKKYFELIEKDPKAKTFLTKLLKAKRYDATEGYNTNTNRDYGTYFELPVDLKYVDVEEITITDGTTPRRVRVKFVTDPHYNLNEKNPFKNPYKDMVWRMNYGVGETALPAEAHELIIPPGYSIVYYYLYYVKYPTAISLATNNTSELDLSLHDEVIDTAVLLTEKAYKLNSSIQQSELIKEGE